MLDLTNDQLTTALAIVAAVALLSGLITVVFALRLRKLRRQYTILRGEASDKDIVAAISSFLRRIDSQEGRLDGIVADLKEHAMRGRLALQRFHIVRYDAFEDMGGRLSFSAALLDDHGDGVVITSINGRTETRTYAKPVRGMSSEHNLSEEEREAITGAAAGHERGEAQAATRSR
ncbi:MAG: DUF4446 family protein [Actinomycetota bacterium]